MIEMWGDYLARALADEEHLQGMPVSAHSPDHCAACDVEAHRRIQALCPHDGARADVTSFEQADKQYLCQICGSVFSD